MSTKIYNGYLIRDVETLEKLIKLLHDFRDKVSEKAKELVAITYARICAEILDNQALGKEYCDALLEKKFDSHPLSYALRCCEEHRRKIRKENRRDPLFDFDCEVVALASGKKTLAMLYTEQEEYVRIWREMPGVEAYEYYDNTDRPEHCTEEEWDDRGNDWELAVGHHPPGEAGLRIECITDYTLPIPSSKDVIKYIPEREKRIQELAKESVIDAKLKEKFGGNEIAFEDGFRAYREVSRFVSNTDEGKALLELEKQRIDSLIKKEYVAKDLVGQD